MRFSTKVLLFFCLFPSLAAGQGSIGPLQKLEEVGVGVFQGAIVTRLFGAGDLAYFTVDGAYTSETLWRSDGTPEGTFELDRISGVLSPKARFWVSDGYTVYFLATGGAARSPFQSLWRSDGTVEGTRPLAPFGLSYAPLLGRDDPSTALAVPETGLVFLSMGDKENELWATDGTPEGTRLVKDIHPEGSSIPRFMTAFHGELFFLADLPQGLELWRSDGTAEGTGRVQSFHHLGDGDGVAALERVGDALYLLAQTAAGVELWISDGTGAGTTQALSLPSARLLDHAVAGERLFLSVEGQVSQDKELWAAGGGSAAPVRILESASAGPLDLFGYGDGAVFSLADAATGIEPWVTDGTPEGTRRIADICPGPCDSWPAFLAVHAGRVVFMAFDGSSGREPWATDGRSAHRLGDLCPGACNFDPWQIVEVNGWLALRSLEQIWMADGSRDGAFQIAGPLGSSSFNPLLLPLGDRLLLATATLSFTGTLWSLPVTAPVPPEVLPGQWLTSPQVPGFRFKTVIEGQSFSQQAAKCLPGTLCAMGGPRGIAEVFLRVSGPRPDGSVWPAAVKLTTAAVDVWIHQVSTGYVRHHRLERADPSSPVLPGVLDRGFFPANPLIPLASVGEAAAPRPPSGPWVSYKSIKGYRVKARYASGGKLRNMRQEACLPGTFCLSGAVKGQTEVLVRVADLQPRVARFIPARVEVWIEHTKTKAVRYYRMDGVPPGSLAIHGYVDWEGFKP